MLMIKNLHKIFLNFLQAFFVGNRMQAELQYQNNYHATLKHGVKGKKSGY